MDKDSQAYRLSNQSWKSRKKNYQHLNGIGATSELLISFAPTNFHSGRPFRQERDVQY